MKRLKIEYTIFSMLVIVALSSILLSQKLYPIMSDKVDIKLNKYLKDNYNNKELSSNKTIYKNTKYQKKVYNKTNNNLYFYIYYNNKKITDTYNKDYLEGKTFLKYISKSIEKDINKKTKYKTKITINNKLNKFNNDIKERLLKENNLLELSIYTINIKIKTDFNKESISNKIKSINNNLNNNKIIPKDYIIEITDTKDITKSVKVSNIKPIDINNINKIMDYIINNPSENIVPNTNIEYIYLN